jgi:nucleotide-binding universal stress UspA family protein
MTGAPPPARRRILIGAGCYADARAAMEIAERLAASAGYDLGGLLLDDPAASETAITPGHRVVTCSGALMLAPDRAQMQRAMASDARAFRAQLSRIAESHAVSWSFEQRRGELFSGLIRAAHGWDLLMIGYRRLRRRTGLVVVIGSGPEPGDVEGAALANTLASILRTGTIRLDAGGGDDTAALLARIGRIHAALIVTDAGRGPFRTGDQLRRLVEAARCPVLVLGAAGIHPALGHSTLIPPAPGV